MSQNRSQHESYLLGVLRAAFPEAHIITGSEDSTLFSVIFPDGESRDITLHFDEDDEEEMDETAVMEAR